MQYRVDDLGRETLFHVLPRLIHYQHRKSFERLLTKFALGYTRSDAVGGWKGEEEGVVVYRVATLTDDQVRECIAFLLHNSDMQDIYVVHADGVARGHCFEESTVGKYESIPAPWTVRTSQRHLSPSPLTPAEARRQYDTPAELTLRPYKGVPDRNAPQLDPYAPRVNVTKFTITD